MLVGFFLGAQSLLPVLIPKASAAFVGSGQGTSQHPYLIETCEQLQSIGDVNEGVVFWLTDNIDCTGSGSWDGGQGFKPINNFHGTLDGRGYTIQNLDINRPSEMEVGLFSSKHDGMVANLSIDWQSTITGGYRTGSFFGTIDNARAYGLYSHAVVTAGSYGGGIAGVIVGWEENSVIEKSAFEGQVLSSGNGKSGGIVGGTTYGWSIRDVLVNANISGDIAGGIVGSAEDSCGYRYLDRAVAKGTVNATTHSGGLVGGYNNVTCSATYIRKSVADVVQPGAGYNGGIVGHLQNSSVTVNDAYYNNTQGATDCGPTITCNVLGSNTAPNDAPYSDPSFDFTNTWTSTPSVELRFPFANLTGPSVPRNIATGQAYNKVSVGVEWDSNATDGSYGFKNYRVEIKKASDSWASRLNYSVTTTPDSTFGYLLLGTEYNIRIQTITAYGGSDWVEVSYTTDDPVLHHVTNCQELQDFDKEVDSRFDTLVLDNNINCSDIENFTPLGYSDEWDGDYFTGVFDGQGHTISNLNINNDNWDVGLFQSSANATFKDVTLEGGLVSAQGSAGGLVGYAQDTVFSHINANTPVIVGEGNVGSIAGRLEFDELHSANLHHLSSDADVSGVYRAGGLFGDVEINNPGIEVVMQTSYSTGTVAADESDGNAGGLIGDLEVDNDDDDNDPTSQFTLQDSYSWASVSGGYSIGGLIGRAESYNDGYNNNIARIVLDRVYSSGNVTAFNAEAGGLVGYLDSLGDDGEEFLVQNSFTTSPISGGSDTYAVIGGNGYFDYDGEFAMFNTWFDPTATGQEDAVYNTEFTGWNTSSSVNQFKNNSTSAPFTDPENDNEQVWDFEEIWQTNENNYPTFRYAPAPEQESIVDDNGDGINDATQPHVQGFTNGVTGKLQALELTSGCTLNDVAIRKEANFSAQDSGYDYPSSFVRFAASCSAPSITVKQYYYGVTGDFVVRKHNPNTNAYFNVPGAVIDKVTIGGQQVLRVSYQIEDNGILDLDPAVGSIVDPVGLGAAVTSVPNTGLQRN